MEEQLDGDRKLLSVYQEYSQILNTWSLFF